MPGGAAVGVSSPTMTRRTVLITGAGNGIGRSAARRFAESGWTVGAYDVDIDALQSLVQELPEADLITGRLDVTRSQDWQAALAQVTARGDGRLDALVNNAGLLRGGRLVDIPLEQQLQLIEVNVSGVLQGCYFAHPHLAATPGATVINLCSASAIYGQPELAAYSASKFAVRGLSEALDLEWDADGINVRAIWPLFVATQMTEGLDTGTTRNLGIHLTAEDVAEVIVETARNPDTRLGVKGFGPRQIHRAVGAQAKALMAAAAMSPSWLAREVNRFFAR